MRDFYDPIYGRIIVPSEFLGIIDSGYFRRLQYLRQLGLCYLSFPGGNHTRFEHSLGAFHLAGLIGNSLEKSTVGIVADRTRLSYILRLAALCHDIGHGPFSHMSENVLLGLGSTVTHEDMGAAILNHELETAFSPFKKFDITPKLIGCLLTHSSTSDPMATCAMDLVSSDLDVDRLDYLQRDSHYAGYKHSISASPANLEEVWKLIRCNNTYYLELTKNEGVKFAEIILFLRRNNYQRIVFDSKHMSATGMFEKALQYAFLSDSVFGKLLKDIVEIRMDWTDKEQVTNFLPMLLKIYGLMDYEALKQIEDADPNSRRLINGIRKGVIFRSLGKRWRWNNLHYLLKHKLMTLKNPKLSFNFRRGFENFLATSSGVDEYHIVAHIPDIRLTKPLLLGVESGGTLGDNSDLGKFLHDDFLRQYVIEIFIDPSVDDTSKKQIYNAAKEIIESGYLDKIGE